MYSGVVMLVFSICFLLIVATAYLIPLYATVHHPMSLFKKLCPKTCVRTKALFGLVDLVPTLGWVRWSSAMEP